MSVVSVVLAVCTTMPLPVPAFEMAVVLVVSIVLKTWSTVVSVDVDVAPLLRTCGPFGPALNTFGTFTDWTVKPEVV